MRGEINELTEKAKLVRKWCLVSTSKAGSGHPTSCLSAADVITVLFDRYFAYDIKNPKNPNNDRLIFSKGHAAPLLYTVFAMAGAFPLKHLLTLRKFESVLEGHPTPRFPFAEAATGSLGQGLSVGAGIAYVVQSSKFKVQSLPKVYVLLGDGEMAEGSVWEAANFSSYYSLNNLIALVDVNRLGQSQETMFGDKIDEYKKRFLAFGWETAVIDGHNFAEIINAYALAKVSQKPFVIIAKTVKGKGVSFLEDKDGWHGKTLKKEELEKALEELGEVDDNMKFAGPAARGPVTGSFPASARSSEASFNELRAVGSPSTRATPRLSVDYHIGDQIATREVYGQVLAKLADTNSLIFSLDGDTKNSTFSQEVKKTHPDHFIECFIAEQNMVGAAVGFSICGKIPFVSTFAAFLTRAFDQIRMAGISRANIKFVGSHVGVSIGEDGPSQMGLEDIAMFGAVPGSIILHPSDGVSTAKLLPQIVDYQGIAYLRTLRPKTPVLYDKAEEFAIGGSKILREDKKEEFVIATCGITVFEALSAHQILKKKGINVSVLDCYSVKPVDKDTLIKKANNNKKRTIITVEDHYFHGGFGDMVLNAVAGQNIRVVKMAVTQISRSGTPAELLDAAGISAKHIVKKVESLL